MFVFYVTDQKLDIWNIWFLFLSIHAQHNYCSYRIFIISKSSHRLLRGSLLVYSNEKISWENGAIKI